MTNGRSARPWGRRQLEPAIYAEVALVYAEAIAKPTEAVAHWYHEFLKGRDAGSGIGRAIDEARRAEAEQREDDDGWLRSCDAAAKLVARSRARGLIPPAGRNAKGANR